ncbi:MAG: hypothetical protein M1617_02190 [Actinobacteria bacterium]|nr:hypothetical protein [Actinomycetota bacterium]MCL5887098.1 hypothetical protein [Actinomycetota bacterium]
MIAVTMFAVPTVLMMAGFVALALLALKTVADIQAAAKPSFADSPAEGAIAVARKRLRAGDIDRQDFDRILRVLTS